MVETAPNLGDQDQSLRARKLAHSRAHVTETAWRLFLARGYDDVTVAEIADAAGVARRTVHRYVTVKSDLVFGHEGEIVGLVEEVVAAAPPGASVRGVLVHALRGLAARWPTSREEAAARAQVIAGSAELVERELAKRARMRELVVDALRSARPAAPELELAVWAESGLAAFYLASSEWVAGRAELPEALDRVLGYLAAQE
ncbi:TetR/AcrR family transcriptional regulator [Cellulosimicrobium protaetiae]|uniref:TetR family transcriptional regulator n=1 Tax=Cellulosimicrobium protaetiae TaxID=2587808 RepID=A0A6M5UGB9_9MICO|nr:TetR/AcrR family transcriptional regulator [Cellulosimicrobium protaetiae]QJW37677.1 TetR family transcriptional regulator [Cellulosimicrobium protaetiae]